MTHPNTTVNADMERLKKAADHAYTLHMSDVLPRSASRVIVRAILEELMQPSGRMEEAGIDALNDEGSTFDALNAFQAMICSILEDDKG